MRGLNLGANPVLTKGREAAESIRERWETSDSPLVHRIQVRCGSLRRAGRAEGVVGARCAVHGRRAARSWSPASRCLGAACWLAASPACDRHVPACVLRRAAVPNQCSHAVPPPPSSLPPPCPPQQDAVDSLQSESEQARALREIRARDPSFDMVTFLRNLKSDVSTVIKVSTPTCGRLHMIAPGPPAIQEGGACAGPLLDAGRFSRPTLCCCHAAD